MGEYTGTFDIDDLISVVVNVWGNVFLLVMIFSLYAGKIKDRNNKSIRNISIPYTNEILCFYSLLFFYNLIYVIITLLGMLKVRYERELSHPLVFLYYVDGALLTILFLYVVKKYVTKRFEDKCFTNVLYAMVIVQQILLLLLFSNIFTKVIYYYDDDLVYPHSWGYFVWQGYSILAYLMGALAIFKNFKKVDNLLKRITNVVIISVVAGLVACLLLSNNYNNLFMNIAALLMYVQYENHRTECAIKNVVDMEDAQKKLMMDQIKPHFLYNSLNSIIYYIDKDPEVAKDSLVSFSKYLRTNLNMVSLDEMIPFSQEMEHTKVYLSLEKLRFEDKLTVDFDIKDEDYKVPALSIQPMVENAVKHGIRKSASGRGSVKISTREMDDYHVIMIEDDGVGFNTEALATMDDTHIGVKNVMKRLEMECKGTLEFESSEGKGTICTIRIPK